jgi:hypothetical protein
MSWFPVNTGLTDKPIRCLALSPDAGGTGWGYIFAGTQGDGVYRSTNNGMSWAAVNTGLTGKTVEAFAVSPPSGGAGVTNLFAGTLSGGVFLSTNNGANWSAVNAGLKDTAVYPLVVSGSNLFAGTPGSGVWKRPLSEMITSIGGLTGELPYEFSLRQNYPNPFNPSTIIRYSLPATSHVALSVYNALGQPAATLVDENQEAGFHEVRFDGTRFASGVYFYRLRTGNYTETKKAMLVR